MVMARKGAGASREAKAEVCLVVEGVGLEEAVMEAVTVKVMAVVAGLVAETMVVVTVAGAVKGSERRLQPSG